MSCLKGLLARLSYFEGWPFYNIGTSIALIGVIFVTGIICPSTITLTELSLNDCVNLVVTKIIRGFIFILVKWCLRSASVSSSS